MTWKSVAPGPAVTAPANGAAGAQPAAVGAAGAGSGGSSGGGPWAEVYCGNEATGWWVALDAVSSRFDDPQKVPPPLPRSVDRNINFVAFNLQHHFR